jgi:hypothetical protein
MPTAGYCIPPGFYFAAKRRDCIVEMKIAASINHEIVLLFQDQSNNSEVRLCCLFGILPIGF